VIIGIFLVALSAWTVFSVNQVKDTLLDDELQQEIESIRPAIRHAAIFIYKPPRKRIKSFVASSMFLLPPTTLLLVAVQDLLSTINYDHKAYLISIYPALIAHATFVSLSFAFCAMATIRLISVRRRIAKILYDNPRVLTNGSTRTPMLRIDAG